MTPDEYLARAAEAKDAGELEDAIALYTQALALRPAECEALVERGNCYCMLERFQEAVADFRTALTHEPDPATRAGIHYNIGNASMDLGLVAPALAEYDAAARLDPSFGWAHHGRGHALSVLGRHADSLAAYTESARLLPGHPLPVNGVAVALAELGRHAEALAAFDEVLRLDPTSTAARDNRALLVRQMEAAPKRTSRTSAKAQRLYRRFSELCGGEPADLWTFDPLDMTDPPPFLGVTQVMAWPADEHCDVTSFLSLGMSDRRMTGADYFCEVHFGIRAALSEQQRLEVARRVADICAYPFEHGRKLDWWEVIRDPGRWPGFEGCKHLLLHPRFSGEGFDHVHDPDGLIKVLYLVPITSFERDLIVDVGRAALIDHWIANGTDVLTDRHDAGG